MPTQLQLDGPELEPLLARVRAEHGSSARIVQAEKVRTGGVGGFFAKARFEITVELDDLPAEPAPARRPTTILDLADEVSSVERSAATVSTEGSGFAAVLARLGATAGADAAAPERPLPVPSVATLAVPAQRSAPDAESVAPAPEGIAVRPPAALPVVRRRTAPAPVRTRQDRAVPNSSAVATRSRAAAPTAARSTSSGAVAVRTVAAPGRALATRAPGTVAARPVTPPVRHATARTAPALQVAARSDVRTGDLHAQLDGLGLPAVLQPQDSRGDLRAALTRSLRDLPRAPRTPTRAGSVLALVGDAALVKALAQQLAEEHGLPRTAVVAAGTGATAGARESVRRRSAQWKRRAHVTLLVVDTPLTAAGALRTRALLDAVEPTGTWGVVEATRKPRDVAAWTQAVGRVDALALTAVDETADPAAVLSLGIPVGRLGRDRATPAVWAGLLADRVAA